MAWGQVAAALVPGMGSALGQWQANVATKKLTREQMEFQERMSSTAWQRGVRDMEAAGLNPALAYQQGGASSPAGQTAQMHDVLGPGMSSAMSGIRLRKDLALQDQQIAKTRAEGSRAAADATLAQARLDAYGISRHKGGGIHFDFSRPGLHDLVTAEVSSARSAARLMEYQLPEAAARAKAASGNFGKWTAYAQRLFGSVSPLIGGIGGGMGAAALRKPTTIVRRR